MAEQVEIDLVASDKGTPAWKRQADAVHAYLRELAALDQAQQKNARSAKAFDDSSNWQSYIPSVATATGAINLLAQGIRGALDFQKQLHEAAVATVKELDKATRIHQNQAGLSDVEAVQATAAAINLAEKHGAKVRDVQAAQTQAVSGGFADPEQTTDVLMSILASSSLDSSQAGDISKAGGRFLFSMGKEKNAKNLLDLGIRMRGLYSKTDVQMGDLSAFSQAAPAFGTAGVSMEDTLSALAIMKQGESEGVTATHGKNIVSLMASFANDKGKTEALKKMGLKPSQLDLSGESLPQALAAWKEGLEKLKDDATRSQVMSTLVGADNLTGAAFLLNNVDKFKEYGAAQHDTEGFEKGVRTTESGYEAQSNRLEAQTTRGRAKTLKEKLKADLLDQEWTRRQEELVTEGKSTSFDSYVNTKRRDMAVWIDPNQRENYSSPEMKANAEPKGADFSLEKLQQALDANTKATQEATQTAKEVANKPLKFTPRTDTRPAPDRPSKLLESEFDRQVGILLGRG